MKRNEMIEIAKRCDLYHCNYCPLSNENHCRTDLIKMLVAELEKSTLVITVKKGKTNENK